ncbi:sugar phosphate isomerase/epimerase family protein [Bacteroidota bacterium]
MKKEMKQNPESQPSAIVRRSFLKSAGIGMLGITGIGIPSSAKHISGEKSILRNRKKRLKQMASNSYAVNKLFKRRTNASRPERPESIELKKKYGEITLLDFPQFTLDTYPGVIAMDLWSSLFGDITDDSMFTRIDINGRTRLGFDPGSPSAKRYLDLLAGKIATTGIKAVHISNNAPRNIADLDEESRREGIRVAKLWLDASKQIGVQSMRVNTGGPRIIPASVIQNGYPQNLELGPYLKKAIESFKEMADYGEKVGVKVTIENHWGLAANPINIRIIINAVNSSYCEASPDFCNWEHEYMLYNGLEVLIPMAKSMCHAKRWTRFPDVDIARCVQVLNDAEYKGYISTEYEAGGDPVAGTLKLLEDVVAALQ